MTLDDIPLELILLILRGAAVEDILNFTRTSSYFRCMSLSNRRLWTDASDAHGLRLPPGETLATTSASLLPVHAMRSALISRKWRASGPIAPVRTYELKLLYDHASWAMWAPRRYLQRSLIARAPPTYMNVLPGGNLFLFGTMARLGVYTLDGRSCRNPGCDLDIPSAPLVNFFNLEQFRGAVDWDSADNGAHITLATLSRSTNANHDVESSLCVFSIEYTDPYAGPSVVRTHLLKLPALAATASGVCIRDSTILVHSSTFTELWLVDAKENTHVRLYHSSPDEVPESGYEISSATIFPSDRSLIALALKSPKNNTRTVQLVDIPPDMPPIDPQTLSADWPSRPLQHTPCADPVLLRSASDSHAPPDAHSFCTLTLRTLQSSRGAQMLVSLGKNLGGSPLTIVHTTRAFGDIGFGAKDIIPSGQELHFPCDLPGVGHVLGVDFRFITWTTSSGYVPLRMVIYNDSFAEFRT
ncbi:hypothetical protein C8J57DRAFT_1470521 [Mycena rebaudengoi]|nr:hypothetical protein C8J57DRAFT_1470521 [Mycena rebaudengoi]